MSDVSYGDHDGVYIGTHHRAEFDRLTELAKNLIAATEARPKDGYTDSSFALAGVYATLALAHATMIAAES